MTSGSHAGFHADDMPKRLHLHNHHKSYWPWNTSSTTGARLISLCLQSRNQELRSARGQGHPISSADLKARSRFGMNISTYWTRLVTLDSKKVLTLLSNGRYELLLDLTFFRRRLHELQPRDGP